MEMRKHDQRSTGQTATRTRATAKNRHLSVSDICRKNLSEEVVLENEMGDDVIWRVLREVDKYFSAEDSIQPYRRPSYFVHP